MNHGVQIVLLEAGPDLAAPLAERLAGRGLEPRTLDFTQSAASGKLGPADVAVVVVDPAERARDLDRLTTVLEELANGNVNTLVWGSAERLAWTGGTMVEWLAPTVSADEVVGRLSTLARYVPLVQRLERELDHLQRLGEQLNRYFGEIDQEMRLAGRLQRDFLPRKLPHLPPLDFDVIYRPASWVSGDIYDVFRIDDQHIGVFIADAMGHGVAAGLLTMFLRQALVPRQVETGGFSIVSPIEALTNLHDCLVRQKLPNSQFVTAVYAIIDTAKLEVRLARAGHPYPLHVAHGLIHEVPAPGGLLGLADVDPEFEEQRIKLEPGDKLVLYTDGLEEAFLAGKPGDNDVPAFSAQLHEWVKMPAADFVATVNEHLDQREGSLHPADDMTVLVLEVAQSEVVVAPAN